MSKNNYIKLDGSGNVVSTVKTDGVIPESDTLVKVDNCEDYIGKKFEMGRFITPDVVEPEVVDVSTLAQKDFMRLVLDRLGVPCR